MIFLRRALLIALWGLAIGPLLSAVKPQRPIDSVARPLQADGGQGEQTVPFSLDSGLHDGQTSEYRAFSAEARSPGAASLRVHFDTYSLGAKSYLTLTSLADGASQRFDTASLAEWAGTSAYFNGDAVRIELYVAPTDRQVFFRLNQLFAGQYAQAGSATINGGELAQSCADERVTASDPRVGRIMRGGTFASCTAWLLSNGTVLTAGHCADSDPDREGPLLPDGIVDLGGTVEFNVPPSRADGTPVHALPRDQYPINAGSFRFEFPGDNNNDLGHDWAIFTLGRNANSGLTAHQAYGFFRPTSAKPKDDVSIRLVGYGTDNSPPGSTGGFNSQSQTQQQDTGPYRGTTGDNGGIAHEFDVVGARGNSGSPIIVVPWENHGFTIGIMTHGACDGAGYPSFGTAFEHRPLYNAVRDYRGPNTVYVDSVLLLPYLTGGTVFTPWQRVGLGVQTVPTGGTVSIVAGSYNERLTIDRSMRLEAPVGGVIIGR